MFNRLRIIAIVATYAFGLTSLFTYYTADDSDLLLASVLVIMLAHVVVAIGTIRTTLDLASGKRKNSDPSPHVTNPTIRLWKQAIKRAWPWHAALIVPKMGLSLAFAQYLHITHFHLFYMPSEIWWGYRDMLWGLSRAFNYASHIGFHPYPIFPQWETTISGLLVLTLFTMANLTLIIALALLWNRLSKRIVTVGTILGRGVIAVIVVIGILVSYPLLIERQPNCTAIYPTETSCWSQDAQWGTWDKTYWRVIETIYTSGLSLVDHGVLLSANIMRPVGKGTLFAQIYDPQTHSYYYDNRPFVLRQMVAAGLGLGLYGLLTWGALRLAKRDDP